MIVVCARNIHFDAHAPSQARGHDDEPTPYHDRDTRAARIPNTDLDVFADTSNFYQS